MKRRLSALCVLVVSLLALPGCGDTTVAFCSGGDDFCDDFIVRLGGEDDDGEEEEDETPEEAEPTSTAVQAATKVAQLTPPAIDAALVSAQMGDVLTKQPDLVGLWLIDASLALLRQPSDNAATTRFLDQNRAWLFTENDPGVGGATADFALLTAGLDLFAALAEDLDPAGAEAARGVGDALRTPGNHTDATASVVSAQVVQIVVGAAQVPERCCTEVALAASAVVLCAAQAPPGSGQRACGLAGQWLAANNN